MKTVQFDTFHNNYVFHYCGWTFLLLFKPISRNRIEKCMNIVPCTFRCTLYLPMYFVLSLLKVQSTSDSTSLRRNQYLFYGKYKKGTKYGTSKSKFMYFRMYSVLSIVLCTFKCMLKGTICTLTNVGKHDFTFSTNQNNTSIMHAHAFFCMITSISTTVKPGL